MRVARRTFKGKSGIDIRLYASNADGQKTKTPRRLVIDRALLDPLIAALERARVSTAEDINNQ